MAEYGTRQENPDEARHGWYCRYRQERCKPKQRQYEQPYTCRTDDDVCIGSNQRLYL